MVNIDRVRQDLPHYGDMIFLNSAGASLMAVSVVEKIKSYLHEEEKFGGYFIEDQRVSELEEFYREAS